MSGESYVGTTGRKEFTAAKNFRCYAEKNVIYRMPVADS
jgi:hypothetical protein